MTEPQIKPSELLAFDRIMSVRLIVKYNATLIVDDFILLPLQIYGTVLSYNYH